MIIVILLFVATGLGIGVYQTFWIQDSALSTASVGEMLGRAAVAAFIGLLVAIPWWRLTSSKHPDKRRPSLGAVLAGLILVASVAYYSNLGLEYRVGSAIAQSGYEFHPPGCELTIRFPDTPKLTPISIVAGNTVVGQQAELGYRDAYLRAECIVLPSRYLFSEEAVRVFLEGLVQDNGLENVAVQSRHDGDSVSAFARGTKVIAGTLITYEIRTIYTEGSRLSVVTGGPTAGYPQQGIAEFQSSVRPAP